MDSRLVAAATTGNVDDLFHLIREDSLLLDGVASAGAETPLHIASSRGHLPFVQEMLKLRTDFAHQVNQDGYTPLHLASASGHLQIVLELLKAGHNLCYIQDREQKLAVHCAVVKGQVPVIKELLLASPDSVERKTARGETVFHLAVKNNRFDAFKLLVELVKQFQKEQVLNEKDNQGNTVLHLAALRKQHEVVQLLFVDGDGSNQVVDVNCLNERGMTPLDVLVLFRSEAGDLKIHTALFEAGAKRGKDMSSSHQVPTSNAPITQTESMNNDNELAQAQPISNKNITASRADLLMTVAALIATATFQGVLTPPRGLWQEDNFKVTPPQVAGTSIMGTKNPVLFIIFIVGCTVGFECSLTTILFLVESQSAMLLSLYALSFTYGVA